MKEIKQFVVLVDGFRNGLVYREPNERLYTRNTEGRYIVAAKDKVEAESLVRTCIGFGSPKVYYEDKKPKLNLEYGMVRKQVFPDGYLMPKYATEQIEKRNSITLISFKTIAEIKEFFS